MANGDQGLGGFQVDDDWKKQAQEEKRRLAEEAQASKPKPAAPAPAAGSQSAARRKRELPPADFKTLVDSLAKQVNLYLGGVAVSEGQGILDLDAAKHNIDLLGVLEAKTEGNLDADEKAELDSTLYETRMRFVSTASRYIL